MAEYAAIIGWAAGFAMAAPVFFAIGSLYHKSKS